MCLQLARMDLIVFSSVRVNLTVVLNWKPPLRKTFRMLVDTHSDLWEEMLIEIDCNVEIRPTHAASRPFLKNDVRLFFVQTDANGI